MYYASASAVWLTKLSTLALPAVIRYHFPIFHTTTEISANSHFFTHITL